MRGADRPANYLEGNFGSKKVRGYYLGGNRRGELCSAIITRRPTTRAPQMEASMRDAATIAKLYIELWNEPTRNAAPLL
jgi:hypothetical protein